MSGLLPPDTTLQLSTPAGDITHQGVLGSNASRTTLLPSTFPTTSTSTSLGHYHYTEPTTNSLKFLNASGTGQGGHQFWHSSSTQAPIKVLEANRNETLINTQLTIDKSSTPTPPVFSPLIESLSTDNKTIFFPSGTNLTQAPYNMTQLFNPIYMTQGTSTYTNGSLCYAMLADNERIQIFNNNNITNPIPPNVTPSEFGNSSNVGLVVGQTVFSLTPPSPSITQTAILSDTLAITTDTDESILSATDLTFNSVSLPTQVSTNSTNIATNSTNIATNSTNIATNTTDINLLEVKQTQVLQVYASPAIFADARSATSVPTASSNSFAQFGWYFKNSFTSGSNKIGWYMPPAIGMRVQDVLGLYLRFFNCSTTSNDNTPFLTIYTKPTGTNDVIPGFIHSSMTYIFDQSVTPVANTSYTMFENVSGTCPNPNSYASNLVGMEVSPVNNPRGEYLPTELILAFNIGTNSASPVNSVEFIAQKLGIMTATGTTELLYQTLI